MTYKNTHRLADLDKINKLLFDSEQITSMAIADATNINYQTIYKYRNNSLDTLNMNLDFAIKLTEYYDLYHQ